MRGRADKTKIYISEGDVYGPLNELVTRLEEYGLIHTLPFEKKLLEMSEAGKTAEEIEKALAEEVKAIQEKVPLTLRQALTVLYENFGGYGKITNHFINNKADLGIELADEEIRSMGDRFNNFIASKAKIMRIEDLVVFTAGYQSLALNDEVTFGINLKATKEHNNYRLSTQPILRRGGFQTRGPADRSPLDTMLGLERISYVHDALRTLTPREENVIRLRFYEEQTLEEVGKVFHRTKDSIRKVEVKAIRKLRRARHLKRVM